jgi:hypothetical protein
MVLLRDVQIVNVVLIMIMLIQFQLVIVVQLAQQPKIHSVEENQTVILVIALQVSILERVK